MTEKQKAALKKAQEAARLKKLNESFQAAKEECPVVPVQKPTPLEEKIDKLTEAILGMKQIVEEIAKNQPKKLDLSFLNK